MKLLLDQNLSRRMIPALEPCFPGSTQVALVGLEKAFDVDIWNYARDNGFVIVTKDSDFEELSLLRGAPPKVIWIKLGNVSNTTIVDMLVGNRERIGKMLGCADLNCIEIY